MLHQDVGSADLKQILTFVILQHHTSHISQTLDLKKVFQKLVYLFIEKLLVEVNWETVIK